MHGRPLSLRLLRGALATTAGFSALLYLPLTWHWPLVGDTALIHYITFLISRGWAPYRQLQDMNMPGSFLVEAVAMHLFGTGALGWRLFDFALLALAAGAMLSIAGRRRWFSVVLAGSLFALIHGRDGLAQGGQRDLTIAVALLWATAFLITAVRRRSGTHLLLYGALCGLAFAMKPTALLLPLIQFAGLALWGGRRRPDTPGQRLRAATIAAAGWLLMPLVCLAYLLRLRSLPDFLLALRQEVPYYAGLGHRSLGYIFQHSFSPILPLVGLWLVVLCLAQMPSDREFSLNRRLLFCGLLFALLNCLLQRRALPYYRYPLLAFLLPLIAIDLERALDLLRAPAAPPRKLAGALAALTLVFAAVFLPAQSAWLIHTYRWWQLDMQTSLQHDLLELGGQTLSHHIQCIDSVSGCNTVLYRMHLEPATGVLSDLFLFGTGISTDHLPVILRTRAEFASDLASTPPEVIVVTSELHLTSLDHFTKLELWPTFDEILDTRYTLVRQWTPARPERWWTRNEFPAAYRIYKRTPTAPSSDLASRHPR